MWLQYGLDIHSFLIKTQILIFVDEIFWTLFEPDCSLDIDTNVIDNFVNIVKIDVIRDENQPKIV